MESFIWWPLWRVRTVLLTVRNMSDEQLNSDNPMMRSTRSMMYMMRWFVCSPGGGAGGLLC